MTYVSRVLGLFDPLRAEKKGNKVRTGDTAVVKYSAKTEGARTARSESSSLGGLLLRSSGQEALGIGAHQEEAAQAEARLAQRLQHLGAPARGLRGGRRLRPALDGRLVYVQRQALTGTESVSEMPTVRPSEADS
jgi:hypothetical protein